MCNRLERKLFGKVDVSGAIVRQRFCPAASEVMADTAVEGAVGMKLFIEQTDAAFDPTASGVYPLAQELRTRFFGIGLLFSLDAYAMRF